MAEAPGTIPSMSADDQEEYELLMLTRQRAEAEAIAKQGRKRTPKEMYGPGQKYLSPSDDPKNVGLMGALQSVDETFQKAGGATTDYLSSKGAPPAIAAAGGTAVRMAPDIATLPLSAISGATRNIAKVAGTSLQELGRGLMQSAVKPTLKQLETGEAKVAIDTLLEKGISPNKAGVEKLRGEIDSLNDRISQVIANSPETVRKSDVGQRLVEVMDRARNQVNPTADMEAVRKAWIDFRNHPLLRGKTDIPVQTAQELKKGTYRQLSKKYGEMGSADVESQKALARGLKEEIATKVPEVAGLNAEETKLLKTLNVAERRSLMELNKNPASFAWLAHSPTSFAAFVADRSTAFKALAARIVYRAGGYVGASGGSATDAAGGLSLYEIGKKLDERPANR